MSSFDVILVIVLVAFTAIGMLRGMVREILSISIWLVAGLVAWLFADLIEHWFKGYLRDYGARMVAAFLLLFGATWIVGMIAGQFLQRALAAWRALRIPNLVFGGVIGFARGMVLILIVFLLAGITPIPQQSWWREARLAPFFERIALFSAQFLPRDVARHIRYG